MEQEETQPGKLSLRPRRPTAEATKRVPQVPFGGTLLRRAGVAASSAATACALRLQGNPATSALWRRHPLFLPASTLGQLQAFRLNSLVRDRSFFRRLRTSGHVRAGSREKRSRAGAAELGVRGSGLGFRTRRVRSWLPPGPPNCTAGMVRAAGRGGQEPAGAGPGPPPPRSSAPLLVLPAADEPDDPRPGAGAGVRARVGATLVGGGDPQEQPELVAGG